MTNKILIQNGRVLDPATGLDQVADVAIAEGRIVAIGQMPAHFVADTTLDARGHVVMPGLVDLAARLREPGHEHEGMLESELLAAAAGGVTSLVCPPDTDPALDEPALVKMLKFRARQLSRCRVFPLGALTRGLAGQALTEMAELTEAGCVGFSQAEQAIIDTQILQRALMYASTFDYIVWLRPQDPWLGKGVAASGPLATRMGLSGIPVAAETIALHTIFELMRSTGARVHLCRLSSAAGLELVRQARAEGLPVTCDVSQNALHLIDVDMGFYDSAMRLMPPMRQARDRDALRRGLADGTIDAVVSDHMPVSADEKALPFAESVPGATGLELLLSLTLKWAEEEQIPWVQALKVITHQPVQVLGGALGPLTESAGRLVVGGVADICVFDPHEIWRATPEALRSQGKHTPFGPLSTHAALPGRVKATLVAGTLAYQAF